MSPDPDTIRALERAASIAKVRTIIETWGTERIGSYGTSGGDPGNIISIGLREPHPNLDGMVQYAKLTLTIDDLRALLEIIDTHINPKPCIDVYCPPEQTFTWFRHPYGDRLDNDAPVNIIPFEIVPDEPDTAPEESS